MSMETVVAKLPKHMVQRHKTYAVRVPVPKDIQSVLNKLEVTRSLKTKDFSQALKNYYEVMAEIQKGFEQARAKLKNAAPVSLVGFHPLEAVRGWYNGERAKIAAEGVSGFGTKAEKQNYILGLKADLSELTSSKNNQHAFVEFVAMDLLDKSGYPLKAGSSLPNIDFDDPKYIKLLDHLVSATIELKEFELSVLGEKVSHIANGGIYNSAVSISTNPTQQSVLSGKPITTFIDEFMEIKGGVGKSKSVDDKYAAFAYLTDLVGENYLVENLTRDHFVKIRSLLKAYPKHANKLKALKGMSAQQKRDYAQKNDLPLMSKQNANKIIARLKSLMTYAVSTDLLNKNPCVDLEFHISEEEKAEAKKEKFSNAQLNKLFQSEAFSMNYPKGAAMYWVPLIALFHGMRMEEILILTLNEIKKDESTGIYFFDLTEFTTIELKNLNAIRRIPIHKELENLGFYAYLEKCKNHKGKRLFPELKKSKGKDQTYRKRFSQDFTRYSKKVGVHTKKTVFHSFRRNFSTACLDGQVPTEYENCLAGWSLSGGQQGTYKSPKDASIAVLKEMMDKVEYPNLDLSHLYSFA